MLKNALILLLSLTVIWLSAIVVRLENFRYASLVGMCSEFKADDPLQNTKRHTCLHDTKTRTSFVWHLFYALRSD
jgi:hypothetical protein